MPCTSLQSKVSRKLKYIICRITIAMHSPTVFSIMCEPSISRDGLSLKEALVSHKETSRIGVHIIDFNVHLNLFMGWSMPMSSEI